MTQVLRLSVAALERYLPSLESSPVAGGRPHRAFHPGQDYRARAWDIIPNLHYQLIETNAQKEEIYRLRYRAYLHEGSIEPRIDRSIYDRFDDMSNSWIFGIYVSGELTASIRVSVATNAHPETPSTDVFGDVLLPELLRGKVIVDPTRFVADPDIAKRTAQLPYLTLRLGYIACDYFKADLQLATVRAEHRAFYRKVFLQQHLTELRPYPLLTKPVCLMGVDYPSVRDKVLTRFPFLRSFIDEQIVLFERPIARDLFSETKRPIKLESRATTLATMLHWDLGREVAADLISSRYEKKERQLVAIMVAKIVLERTPLDLAVDILESFFQSASEAANSEEFIWLMMFEVGAALQRSRQIASAQSFYLAAARSAMEREDFSAAKNILARVAEIQ